MVEDLLESRCCSISSTFPLPVALVNRAAEVLAPLLNGCKLIAFCLLLLRFVDASSSTLSRTCEDNNDSGSLRDGGPTTDGRRAAGAAATFSGEFPPSKDRNENLSVVKDIPFR
jgi:hypothetical protein